ncbi:MAG: apolipoprotein N-acyltransferase [Actinomycetota bacterium]
MNAARARLASIALASLAGALVAIGLPPWGIWPTALVGIALYLVVAERVSLRRAPQFVLALVFAWSWLAPAMGWMWQLVPGGFVIAPLLFAFMHAIGATLAARLSSSVSLRVVARVTALALVEAFRHFWPFGGVPLASLALGVADTRLAQLGRVIGPLGLSWWVAVFGGALALLWLKRAEFGWHTRRVALSMIAIVVLLQVLGVVAPRGRETGDTIRIALVQGGGPQGVLAINSNPRDVFDRHVAATRLLTQNDDLDLVVWPENVIDVAQFAESRALETVASEAKRLDAALAVGVTEDAENGFTNAQIVVDAVGSITSRYDKVRRVPYGEYIPLRSFLRALGAPVDRVPRDAVAGRERAIIEVPVAAGDGAADNNTADAGAASQKVPLAVAISWEVFFAPRANDGVAAGGQVVLNPTNGSSYTGEILQRQQVAASQLRAIETGRFVAQAATTGFSVFIDPDGNVLERIAIGKAAVVLREVPLRKGRTWYSQLGDLPVILLMLAVLVFIGVRSRNDSEQAFDDLIVGLVGTRLTE